MIAWNIFHCPFHMLDVCMGNNVAVFTPFWSPGQLSSFVSMFLAHLSYKCHCHLPVILLNGLTSFTGSSGVNYGHTSRCHTQTVSFPYSYDVDHTSKAIYREFSGFPAPVCMLRWCHLNTYVDEAVIFILPFAFKGRKSCLDLHKRWVLNSFTVSLTSKFHRPCVCHACHNISQSSLGSLAGTPMGTPGYLLQSLVGGFNRYLPTGTSHNVVIGTSYSPEVD